MLMISSVSSVLCRHNCELKPGGVFLCRELEARQRTAHLFGLSDSCMRIIIVCCLFMLDSNQWLWGPGDTLELLTAVKVRAAGVTAPWGISCCVMPSQHQQGTDILANEFKMAFKIGALAENYLQEANKMMECVM